jgi:excisionase family DNA binding protein
MAVISPNPQPDHTLRTNEHAAILEDSDQVEATASTISIVEIARRLGVGRLSVYRMLHEHMLPGVRIGRKWIVTRYAYSQWERTCGTGFHRGLGGNV